MSCNSSVNHGKSRRCSLILPLKIAVELWVPPPSSIQAETVLSARQHRLPQACKPPCPWRGRRAPHSPGWSRRRLQTAHSPALRTLMRQTIDGLTAFAGQLQAASGVAQYFGCWNSLLPEESLDCPLSRGRIKPAEEGTVPRCPQRGPSGQPSNPMDLESIKNTMKKR